MKVIVYYLATGPRTIEIVNEMLEAKKAELQKIFVGYNILMISQRDYNSSDRVEVLDLSIPPLTGTGYLPTYIQPNPNPYYTTPMPTVYPCDTVVGMPTTFPTGVTTMTGG